MGFWGYFKDELRWPLIWRPGPLAALVEGLGRALDDVLADIMWFRRQFNPATCEASHVPAHAASRGIARHRLESATTFRGRCERAFAWHALGGGQAGVPRILEHLGYPDCTIVNMRERDPDRWAEFMPRVPVPEAGLGTEDYELVAWAADDTKPARSIVAGVQTEGTAAATVSAAAALVLGTVATLAPAVPRETNVAGEVRVAGYLHGISTATLGE